MCKTHWYPFFFCVNGVSRRPRLSGCIQFLQGYIRGEIHAMQKRDTLTDNKAVLLYFLS